MQILGWLFCPLTTTLTKNSVSNFAITYQNIYYKILPHCPFLSLKDVIDPFQFPSTPGVEGVEKGCTGNNWVNSDKNLWKARCCFPRFLTSFSDIFKSTFGQLFFFEAMCCLVNMIAKRKLSLFFKIVVRGNLFGFFVVNRSDYKGKSDFVSNNDVEVRSVLSKNFRKK